MAVTDAAAAAAEPHSALERLQRYAGDCADAAAEVRPWAIRGRLTRVAGLVLEAGGIKLSVGASCLVELPTGGSVEAEVVGFNGEKLFLMPVADVYGLEPGA